MRAVDRGSVTEPTALGQRNRQGASELDRAIEHFEGAGERDGAFTFTRYKDNSVKQALESLFHGKCAYCESRYQSTQPVDVEHFRPKGKNPQQDHPGYWWLAMCWTNLLPSCIDCNRRRQQEIFTTNRTSLVSMYQHSRQLAGKGSLFPLEHGSACIHERGPIDAERPLLLDPANDQPEHHLVFDVRNTDTLSLVYAARQVPTDKIDNDADVGMEDELAAIENIAQRQGLSAKGAMSIHVYGLNRLGLVQERTELLRRLDYLRVVAEDTEVLRLEVEQRLASTQLQPDDQQLLERVNGHLRLLSGRAIEEIRAATRPEAPYSQLAMAWIRESILFES